MLNLVFISVKICGYAHAHVFAFVYLSVITYGCRCVFTYICVWLLRSFSYYNMTRHLSFTSFLKNVFFFIIFLFMPYGTFLQMSKHRDSNNQMALNFKDFSAPHATWLHDANENTEHKDSNVRAQFFFMLLRPK